MKRLTVLPLLIVAGLVLGACAAPATPDPEPTAMPVATEAPMAKTIVDVAIEAGSFTTLVSALQTAGLVDALKAEGPFTVFAPSDEAFAKLPAGTLEGLSVEQLTSILLYHVVPAKVMAADAIALDGQSADTLLEGKQIAIAVKDGKVMINDATVVTADVEASNGVIHIIDSVLLPPAEARGGHDGQDDRRRGHRGRQLHHAGGRALQTAGLVDALKAEGPFTVFAPSDEAFAKLPAGTLEGLSVEQLTSILLYHVVPAKVMAADAIALDGQSAGTLLEGQSIAISVKDGKVMINDATVVTADVAASNGVIHIIDTVLLPPAG